MLAIAPGCELDVERGPDWLLVRVRNLDLAESDAPPLAERLWQLLEQHFTYRLVLELDGVQVLNSHLIGQLAAVVPADRGARWRDAVVRSFVAQPPSVARLPSGRPIARLRRPPGSGDGLPTLGETAVEEAVAAHDATASVRMAPECATVLSALR